MAAGEKVLLRVGEAAERLSLSRAFLYRQIAAGRLQTIKVGTATRIPVAELERFVRTLMAEQGVAVGGGDGHR